MIVSLDQPMIVAPFIETVYSKTCLDWTTSVLYDFTFTVYHVPVCASYTQRFVFHTLDFVTLCHNDCIFYNVTVSLPDILIDLLSGLSCLGTLIPYLFLASCIVCMIQASYLTYPSLPNLTVPNKNHAAFAISSNSIV